MKAIIQEGKIQVPAVIRQTLNFPENGECELVIEGKEIRVKVESGIPKAGERDPILSLVGLGKEIWDGVPADDYVSRLRDGWE